MKLVSIVYRLRQQRSRLAAMCALVHLAVAAPALAQSGSETAETSAVAPVVQENDDAVLRPAEPDFVVVNLPTTLRLPRFRSNVRITHRFAGNLRNGTFGQQAGNLFGIDQGAIIGFEYRFAVARSVQAAFYRSSFDKTIELHGKYDALQQRRSMPVSVSAIGSIEGADNFQEKYAPAAGAVISRQFGSRVAGYVTPIWAHNTAASLEPVGHDHGHDAGYVEPSGPAHVHRNTTYIGLGGRVRLGSSTYAAGEVALRARGYAPDQPGARDCRLRKSRRCVPGASTRSHAS